MQNPFLITGYDSAKYFCDRETETERIIQAYGNSRNLTLFSLRRMGKSALIRHVFHQLRKDKNLECYYIDIFDTRSLNDFNISFSKGIFDKPGSVTTKVFKQLSSFFSSLRPSITYDSITGTPSIEFIQQKDSNAVKTLEQIFSYLQKNKKKVLIAFDEFQQILNYPENNIEATLRKHIQKSNNINFIFSGSHKHLLLSMFSDHGRPFYQSTEILQLMEIPKEKYIPFIKHHFSYQKKQINTEDIQLVLNWCRNHTYFVQYAFNKIFSLSGNKITTESINHILLTILLENESVYYNYRKLLTGQQWQLLKAIGKDGEVRMPTSMEFIKKYELNAASSVKTALKSLLEKEMIFEENGGYFIYDVFLSRWLERN